MAISVKATLPTRPQQTPSLLSSLYLYYDGQSWEFSPSSDQPVICALRYVRGHDETPEAFYHRIIDKCNQLNMSPSDACFTPNHPEM